MRLRNIVIHSYRQFVDQRLELLPDVTVLVGRNDAGKTGFFRLIDQHFFERTVHGADQSRVHDSGRQPISFDTAWDVSYDDYRDFGLRAAFDRDDVRTIETRFRQADLPSWQYIVNGQPFAAAYTTEDGKTFLRPGMNHHGLFPDPHYLNVGDQTGVHPARLLVPSEFEAQFEVDAGYIPLLREHLHITPEQMLLRLAGFRAVTRRVSGPGIDAPWESRSRSRSPVAAADVQRGLDRVADRITEALQRWWRDPDGLTCRIRVSHKPHCHEINSFPIDYVVEDRRGLELHGSGLQWFISFVVQMLWIQDSPKPLLLTLDEPATPLHPGAQRSIVSLLNSIARRHQLIYTTHSPFMLDWSFPQRIRVLERDPVTRRTEIINRPYVSSGSIGKIWAPLRASIGTTMGGIATIGDTTVLVEGIVDQIVVANASAHLEKLGRAHLNLQEVAVVPYGEEISLKQLIRAAREHNARVVVLVDTDDQGQRASRTCTRESAPLVQAANLTTRTVAGIEDVIGTDDYITFVNGFYGQFAWFTPLDVATVEREIGNRTLGKYLEDHFDGQFQQSFSKVAVAVAMTYELERLSEAALDRLERLMRALAVGAA
jgi:hypothetical protein